MPTARDPQRAGRPGETSGPVRPGPVFGPHPVSSNVANNRRSRRCSQASRIVCASAAVRTAARRRAALSLIVRWRCGVPAVACCRHVTQERSPVPVNGRHGPYTDACSRGKSFEPHPVRGPSRASSRADPHLIARPSQDGYLAEGPSAIPSLPVGPFSYVEGRRASTGRGIGGSYTASGGLTSWSSSGCRGSVLSAG